MSSSANASFQYQVDFRGTAVSLAVQGNAPRPPPPRYGACVYHRPYAWRVSFPQVLLYPDALHPLVRIYSKPVSRINVWMLHVAHTQSPLPDLFVQLRPGIVAGSADTTSMPAIAPKGLASLELQPLVAQLDGFAAEEWGLWGQAQNASEPIYVQFGLIASVSACCEPDLFQ